MENVNLPNCFCHPLPPKLRPGDNISWGRYSELLPQNTPSQLVMGRKQIPEEKQCHFVHLHLWWRCIWFLSVFSFIPFFSLSDFCAWNKFSLGWEVIYLDAAKNENNMLDSFFLQVCPSVRPATRWCLDHKLGSRNTFSILLRMWSGGRALVLHATGCGFNPKSQRGGGHRTQGFTVGSVHDYGKTFFSQCSWWAPHRTITFRAGVCSVNKVLAV